MRLLLFALMTFLIAQTAPPNDGSGRTAPPPAGRPPEGLLSRSNPKTYEVTWEVIINVTPTTKGHSSPMQLDAASMFFPLIPLSTWSRTDLSSVRMSLMRNGQVDPSAPGRMEINRDIPGGSALAILPMGVVAGQSVRCTLVQTSTVWRSDLDDAAAVKVPWPAEWPAETQMWLQPQWLIQSDDPRFAQFVTRIAGDRLRFTPVFVAAKELLRSTIATFRGVEGPGVALGTQNQVRGLRVSGAAESMLAEQGTAVDMVCACVAVLRAAGIPARPVIGVDEAQDGASRPVRTTYVVWGEFFLPGSGWVPFDPDMMRGSHAMNASPERSWPGVGRIKELNTRVPLSFSFRPYRADILQVEYPGAWGWTARGVVVDGAAMDYVRFQMISRPGTIDSP